VRVISGSARGKKLKAPPGTVTRPLTDRIKEALFNVLGQKVEGARFLDVFAGSGQVGIEALSRGAAFVIFIEKHRGALKTIYANLSECRFDSGFEVLGMDVFKAFNILRRRGEAFDIIYLDPPFDQPRMFVSVLEALEQSNLLAKGGVLVIRVPKKEILPERFSFIERYRTNIYGESALVYYQWGDREEDKSGGMGYTG